MQKSIVAWVLLSAVLSGCAQVAVKEAPSNRIAPEQLIATDLVHVLAQVPSLNPQAARLHMLAPKYPFGDALRSALAAAGYQVSIVSSDSGEDFVDYQYTNHYESRSGVVSEYQIMVGLVGVKRGYRNVNGTVEPATELFARGFDASSIQTNNRMFSEASEAVVTRASVDGNNTEQDGSHQPLIQPIAQTKPAVMDLTEPPQTSFRIQVNGRFTPEPVIAGETITVTLEILEAARIACYYQDDSASIMRIYPNRFTVNPTLSEGEVLNIPSSDAWSLVAGVEADQEEIFCVSRRQNSTAANTVVDALPDFTALPIESFEDLLEQLTLDTGELLQSQHLVIPVKNTKGI